jgi:hypothetical protein
MEFGLVKSFDIDDGQLDGMSPQECFVLGYELAEIDWLLKRGKRFKKMVHGANVQRIHSACIDAKRCYSLTWMEGDESESWMMLKCEGRPCAQSEGMGK